MDLQTSQRAATEALELLEEPSTSAELENRRQQSAGNLLSFFNSVIPEATRIIAPVVEKYGFPATQEGAAAFTTAIKSHADAPEIQPLFARLVEKFQPMMPP